MPTFNETVTGYTAVEIYGGVTACKQYLGTQFNAQASAFLALGLDDQRRALIAASRYFDEQLWAGTPTFSVDTAPAVATTLQWPRANVTDRAGAAVSSTAVPSGIVNGCFEMAAIIAANPDSVSVGDQAGRVQSVSEGPASVTFFAPPAIRNGTALPEVVRRLVAQYLGSANNVSYGQSYGLKTDADGNADSSSALADDNQYTQTRA